MKKLIALMLALCMVLGLFAGCGNAGEEERFHDRHEGGYEEEFEGGYEGGYREEKLPTTVEEQVVYDDEIIKITVTGIDTETYSNVVSLFVRIENKTDDWFFLQIGDAVVNGITVPCVENLQVPGNDEIQEEIRIDREHNGSLDDAGIVNVHTIDFRNTYVAAMDFGQTKLCFPSFSIVTSLGSDYEQRIDESGEVIYEQGGITVILKGAERNYNFFRTLLLVKNETGETVTVDIDIIKLNDYVIPEDDISFQIMDGQNVYDGCPRFCGPGTYDSSLEGSEGEQIEKMEFNMTFYLSDSGEEIGRIEGITVELD